jgi:cysteine desulfurase
VRIYLDYNATCPLRESARVALAAALAEGGGNPSSAHSEGRAARQRLEEARERLAGALDCGRDEVVFTSGGSEANALALTAAPEGRPVAVSAIEHPSLRLWQRPGQPLEVLSVDAEGQLAANALEASNAGLVSIARANHEVGTVADVPFWSTLAAERGMLMHTDASQAFGKILLSFRSLGVDLMTVSAHKVGGPVGIGALIVRRGAELKPLWPGGEQESGLRPGTEAVALACAFAAAAEECQALLPRRAGAYRRWNNRLRSYISGVDGSAVFNSPLEGGLPNTLNVSFPGRPGASLVHRLDLEGVAVSHGSACASGSLQASPVLTAMGLGDERARSALRISLGPDTTDEDVDQFCSRLSVVLDDVRPRALA